MLKLVIEDEEGNRTTVPMVRPEISVGRQEGNTIRLTERNVSRRHARILREEGRVWVEDASRYGSRRNGKRFSGRAPFETGDVLVIGDYRLLLQPEDAPADAPFPTAGGPPPLPSSARAEAPVADADTIALPAAKTSRAPLGRLVCMTAPFAGSEFQVLGTDVVIGRAPDCDVVLEHPSVSKQHARIVLEGEDLFIEDLESSNGVSVNGVERKRAALRSGDRIEVGALSFHFLVGNQTLPLVMDDVPVGGSSRVVPLAIGGAVALLLVGGGLFLATRGPREPVETVTVQVDHASRAAFDEGQSHLNAARWDDAIAAFDRVAADSEQAALVASLRERASAERNSQAIYDDVVQLFEQSNFEAAFRRISDIPRGSYYRTRVTDENLERRVLGALIDQRIAASNDAQRAGDLAQARTVLDDVRAVAPDDARITSRLAELDALAAGVQAPREPVAVARAPEPEPERTPREPAPTPERRDAGSTAAAAPDAGRAQPATTRPAPEPTPEPAPSGGDSRARAEELKTSARRAGIQGNHQEAIRLLEQALELNPGDSAINLMLFTNYRAVGNRNRAARALRRYLSQEPGDPRRGEYETWLAENAPE